MNTALYIMAVTAIAAGVAGEALGSEYLEWGGLGVLAIALALAYRVVMSALEKFNTTLNTIHESCHRFSKDQRAAAEAFSKQREERMARALVNSDTNMKNITETVLHEVRRMGG